MNNFIQKNPFKVLVILLGLILVFILVGNFIRKPKDIAATPARTIEIEIFNIGQAPRIDTTGKIQKSGVVNIYAQTSGVVTSLYTKGGSFKNNGQWLIGLSTSYNGSNSFLTQRQISQKQYENLQNNYSTNVALIDDQLEVVNKSDANLDSLREISRNSKSNTEDLLKLNESILSSLEANLNSLENTNVGGVNDDLILSTKQLKSQYLSAINISKSTIASFELDAAENSNSETLARIQKRISLNQLDIQRNNLDLSLELADLQLRLAQINESLMYPSMPFSGVVEKVHVRIGDLVNPGTLLATVAGSENNYVIEVLVTKDIALSVSKMEPSYIHIGDNVYEVFPRYITSEATDGNLFTIYYDLNTFDTSSLTDGELVNISIPVGYKDSISSAIYVPIDAVHVTQSGKFIYVVNQDKALSKEVKAGGISGGYIQIKEGLDVADKVILSRNVIDGDSISFN